jgi:GlcNAc-P-P-Und epimerase
MFLITGGSGFIGSHFHNVIAHQELVNLDLIFKHSATFVQGDIRKNEDFSKTLAKHPIKCIIALAAKHHDFGIGHAEYFDTNEDGTRTMCEAASKYNIDEIVFYSSVAVYGMRTEVSSELLNPDPDSPYGASKLAGEKVLREWAAQKPSRKVLIIRPTVVFGANNKANMFNLIKQIDSGLYFHIGKADNIKSIAYVENLVAATLYMRTRIPAGVSVYNYADEPQLTSRIIGDTIATALQKKIRITLPKSIAGLLGLPFDMAIKLTNKNLPVSSARIKKLAAETHHSAQKIFDQGFKPVFSTTEGLIKMVAWYKAEKFN